MDGSDLRKTDSGPAGPLDESFAPLLRDPDPAEQAQHELEQALAVEWAMRLMS